MIKVTIIVPVFNEQETIIQVLKAISDQSKLLKDFAFEVIVIDDCSTDATLNILENNPDLFNKLINQSRNMGKGAAVIAGIGAASGDYILVQDADLEYSPNDYPALLKPVQNFNADIVMGSRFLAPAWTRVNYFWHKLGNILITFIFNIFNNTTFTDIYTGFILFRKDLLLGSTLKRLRWDQQAEILSIICPKAKAIFEVPITYSGRTYEEGKKIRAYDIIPVVCTIVLKRLSRFTL
jgi:glycosyltransferase involved in cell wall biosynthesis